MRSRPADENARTPTSARYATSFRNGMWPVASSLSKKASGSRCPGAVATAWTSRPTPRSTPWRGGANANLRPPQSLWCSSTRARTPLRLLALQPLSCARKPLRRRRIFLEIPPLRARPIYLPQKYARNVVNATIFAFERSATTVAISHDSRRIRPNQPG
jgi:hypothetical protein